MRKKLIEIIAPGRGGSLEDLQKAAKFLEKNGFRVKYKKDIFAPDLLCANSDEYRFKALREALKDGDSDIIWCWRGGYGTTRLMRELLKLKDPEKPKLLVGFSDITALHIFLNQKWKWPSLHAPVLAQITSDKIDKKTVAESLKIISGKRKKIVFSGLRPLNSTAKKLKKIKAEITGGNLALIQTGIGTDWQLDSKNKIILLEDVDEKSYRIDRMLTQLKDAEIFNKAAAIIFADFIDNEYQENINKVIKRFAENINIPCLQIKNIGHGKTNLPVMFGKKSELRLGKKATLTTVIS